MERRKFIAGLGSLTAAGAAGIGTGAFTSVTADRSVSIDTAGDASAFLGITKAKQGSSVTPNAQEYVDGDPSTGEMSLDFTNSDDTAGSASGINRNAKTVFDNLLDVTNNGSQEVNFWIESDLIASNGGFLGIYAENTQGDDSDNVGFDYDPESGTWGKVTLEPGKSETNIGIYIPADKSPSDIQGGTLTFMAEKTGGNQD